METSHPPQDIDSTPPETFSDVKSHKKPSPPSDPGVLRYREGIVFIAAAVIIVCTLSYLMGQIADYRGHGMPVSGVVVRRPDGAVEILPRKTTVGGVLEKCGVDTAGMDEGALAERIADGTRIAVEGEEAARRVTVTDLPPNERLALGLDFDINRASVADLALIPGIGEASAWRVAGWRKSHGPILSAEDLAAVPGLGEDRAKVLLKYVDFGGQPGMIGSPDMVASTGGEVKTGGVVSSEKLSEKDPPLDINRAGVAELMRLPGVGEVTAKRIIDYRTKHGPFKRAADLDGVEGIGKKKAEKIGRYVRFNTP